MKTVDSKWLRALRALEGRAVLITPRALALAHCELSGEQRPSVLMANRYLNRAAKKGKLIRLERGLYALPDRVAAAEPRGVEVAERLRVLGWAGTVDVWRAYLLLHASPDLRDACWRRPDRGLLIQRLPGYSARERDVLVLALWAAASAARRRGRRRGISIHGRTDYFIQKKRARVTRPLGTWPPRRRGEPHARQAVA